MPDGRRLLIVEEALKDFVGHWYEYVKAVAELARVEGAEVTVIAHARTEPAVQRELGILPLFERSPWDGDYREPFGLWRKLGVVRHAWHTFAIVRRVVKARGPFDCTFVPTVFLFQIWGWRLLYGRYGDRLGRLVLLVRNNAATYRAGSTTPRFGLAARILEWGIRSFTGAVTAGRVVFATDSDRLAGEYRELTGLSFEVFPSPRVATPAPRTPRTSGPRVFACPGPARLEKGIDLLQQAIALYLADAANPPARFVIQWPSPITDTSGAPYLPDAALSASGCVQFLTEPLDSAGYEALLGETDCMVLPYRRDAYFARISGVAVEAVTAGIPVIATEGTWTADFVAGSGAGIAVPDGDVQALASAMADMARSYPAYRQQAEARSGAALASHSAEAFMRGLWGEARAGHTASHLA